MGDEGAKALAKALATNSTLQLVYCVAAHNSLSCSCACAPLEWNLSVWAWPTSPCCTVTVAQLSLSRGGISAVLQSALDRYPCVRWE